MPFKFLLFNLFYCQFFENIKDKVDIKILNHVKMHYIYMISLTVRIIVLNPLRSVVKNSSFITYT